MNNRHLFQNTFERLFIDGIEDEQWNCCNVVHNKSSIYEHDKIYKQIVFVGDLQFVMNHTKKGRYNIWFRRSDVDRLTEYELQSVIEVTKKYLESYQPIKNKRLTPSLYIDCTDSRLDYYVCYC